MQTYLLQHLWPSSKYRLFSLIYLSIYTCFVRHWLPPTIYTSNTLHLYSVDIHKDVSKLRPAVVVFTQVGCYSFCGERHHFTLFRRLVRITIQFFSLFPKLINIGKVLNSYRSFQNKIKTISHRVRRIKKHCRTLQWDYQCVKYFLMNF